MERREAQPAVLRVEPDRLLWAVIAASTLLRLWLAWAFLGFVTGDDVEVLGAGFHGALGVEHRPWEIRNLLMPELVVRPALEVAQLLGVESAGGLVRVALLSVSPVTTASPSSSSTFEKATLT